MATELLILSDSVNQVNFLSGEAATTGYVKRNLEGLDPPPLAVKEVSGKPIYSKYKKREITITFGIKASDAADLASKQTKLVTILENTRLYWESRGGRGSRAQFQYRRPGGTNISYIDVYSGECDWGIVEHQRGAAYAYALEGAQVILTCEPCFHPNTTTNLVATTVYNHDDGGTGHDNFVSIAAANIKGDVEAPIRLQCRHMMDHNANLIRVFRRTRGTLANFQHHLEAEDAGTVSNWPDAVDAECSNGNKVSQGSGTTSGYVQWNLISNLDDMRGRLEIYARGKASDKTTDKFRASVVVGGVTAYTGDWKYPTQNNVFVNIPLGDTILPPADIPSGRQHRIEIKIEYSKASGDTVELDCAQFMPIDESALWIQPQYASTHSLDTLNEYVEIDLRGITNNSIPFWAEFDTNDRLEWLWHVYGELFVRPGVATRFYFNWTSDSNDTWTVDNNILPSSLGINIDYLPQYLSPLE